MWDREFYTADGRDWYEPYPKDCIEQMSEARTMDMHHVCMTCGQDMVPQMVRVHFERTRSYVMKGMVAEWSGWSEWTIVGFEHLNGCPLEALPF